MSSDPAAFIRAQTAIAAPPLTPEIRLHLASEVTPLWHATEASLAKQQLPPPYWAFAWAGGQALARYLLDHRDVAAGQDALDFGAGSGLVAIAARMAGARRVTAAEIDPFATAAIAMNARLNNVSVALEASDVIGRAAAPWTLILAGDMCYERPLAERLIAWLKTKARGGATVLLGDPGRAYLPKTGLTELARYAVPTPLDLEDRTERIGIVWRLAPD
ncbi:MAG TPA: 50S ribosomal protein L11 methyltransferase [Stellaceae bacterium]|nr:50S ribosomal protein L11 methyltransferase [Stellaceae bacterium]